MYDCQGLVSEPTGQPEGFPIGDITRVWRRAPTYGVFKLFQQLWDLNQKYQDLVPQYPSLATCDDAYDIGHWPWGLVIPLVVRLAILWALLLSFSGMGILRLHHRRLKEARLQAGGQAQAA